MRGVRTILVLGLLGGTLADVLVTLRQGLLFGTEKKNRLTKEPYYAFLGIPYAKPPVGEKRFKAPEDAGPWHGILNATQEGSQCLSYNLLFRFPEGEEDCLTLNVYTPKKPEELEGSPLAVMVWIHGGGFLGGSGRPSDYGPDILIRHDIILVAINYRLNVFGFLSVQNDLVPGNAGLKDQVKALKWVQNNIAAFGGNPKCVTIFGESAGGASVHYLMLSPSAKGLFHRAIAQSGVAVNPWASTRDIKSTAFKLGEMFDCNTPNPYELVDCLQQVKAKELVAYQYNILSMKSRQFLTKNINLPCVEPPNTRNAFLTEIPYKVMESGNFTDVPLLLGVAKVEALMFDKLFADEVPPSIRALVIDQINLKPELLLPRNWAFENLDRAKKAGLKMKEFYFHNKTLSNETIDNLINAASDSWFVLGVYNTAKAHSKFQKSPVFLYQFSLETEFAESEKPLKVDKPGPSHADDLKYFFYMWDKDIDISPEDMDKILKLNRLWINFAKFGNPTPDDDLGFVWEPFKNEKKSYLEIGEKFVMKTDLEKERMEFWENLFAEANPFYIYNKFLEDSTILRDENLQLTIENEKLRKEWRDGGGGGTSADQDKIQALEQKILHQQEELTSLHKRRGEYAQQIVDLNAEVQKLNETIAERDAKITKQEDVISNLELEVCLYVNHIKDLDGLNQTIRDEHTALQLAFSSLEEKLRQVQSENQKLVDRLMKYKTKDAEKLNEENENFMKKKQAVMLKELEEAVKESGRTVSPEAAATTSVPVKSVPSTPSVQADVHDGEVNAVRWSPFNRLVATGGADRKVKLWDVSKGGTCESKGVLVGSNAGVMSVDFDSTGTLLLAASNDFASRVWTVEDQRLRHTLTGHSGKVMAAKFLDEPSKVVTGSHDRTLKIWDLRSKACVETKFAGSSCNDLVTSDSAGSTIISGHFDKKIRFWDTRVESSANDILLNGKITSLDLSRDAKYLLSCVRDDSLKLLDLRMNQIVTSFSAEGFKVGCDWARATFSPDGQHIVVGSADGSVYVWSVVGSRLEALLKAHTSPVTAVSWLPFGTAIASVDRAKKIVIWGDV